MTIGGAQARHATTVLRLKPGDAVVLLDGRGQAVRAVITACQRGQVAARIVERLPLSGESPLALTVAQAFLKSHKMDTVIRHLTELGIHRWLPFASRRSVARPQPPRLERRVQRWRYIAGEALKQCRRSRLPRIRTMQSLEAVLYEADPDGLNIVFWEEETRRLEEIIGDAGGSVRRALVVIGPEGGFTAREVRAAEQRGFTVASLGPRILRAETAALTACALLQHRLGDLG